MKHPDFDKAFAPTPEIVSLSIEAAFRKGEKAMKLRHKVTAMLSAAAVLLVVCAAAVFALPNEPQPDVVSQPKLIENAEINVIYYNPKGNYYHFEKDCSGMLGAEAHTFAEAMADEKKPCPVCVLRKVYATENGKYCHYDEHCSGMMNAIVDTESNWYDKGKGYCPICMEPNTWIATGDPYYHYDMDCCGDAAVGATENAALELNCFPCPICASGIAPMPEPETYNGSISMDAGGTVVELESHPMSTITPWVTAAPTPTPEPEEFNAEVQIVYHTEQGTYYHLNMHCSGMMNAKPHTVAEAEKAGKIPCPVCVQGEAETDWFANETLAADGVPQPADHMCAIGQEYFMEIFDHGLFATFPHVDMEGSGKQTDDYIWEEAVYTNDSSLYLAVYREMNKDTLMSGRIALMFPEDFDHDLFSSEGAQWYRNTYALAMETLENLPMNSRIDKLSSAFTQVYVWFDGELRPNVCEMEFETDSGFFSLSFDIDGDEPSFAAMNYNVTRA